MAHLLVFSISRRKTGKTAETGKKFHLAPRLFPTGKFPGYHFPFFHREIFHSSEKHHSIVVAWLLSHEELKWYVFKTFFYIILSEQVFVSQLNLEWSRCWEICIRYFFLHPCWPLPQSVPHESAFCTVIWAISTLRNTFCTLQMQWLLLDTDLEWLEIH